MKRLILYGLCSLLATCSTLDTYNRSVDNRTVALSGYAKDDRAGAALSWTVHYR